MNDTDPPPARTSAPTSPVEIGVRLPTSDPFGTGAFPVVDTATRADAAGLDAVWIGDHLSFHAPMLDSLVTLGAVAASTTRTRVGLAVLLAALREPVALAKQLATLQILSGGRLQLGIGVGGENPAEWAAAGVPTTERGRRTDVLLDALPDLLAGRPVDLPPPYDRSVPALTPAVAAPRLLIGGRSDAALRRTVRHDADWLAIWASADRVRRARERLDELAVGARRPRVVLDVFVAPGATAEDRTEGEQFLARTYGAAAAPAVARHLLDGSPDAVATALTVLHVAGADAFVLTPAALDPLRALDHVAAVVGRTREVLP
ncbi:LLM class flavin-dependent oxidoreductase [Pseudonocardia nematodicida]|uniref:LLM class flavin-dependent oxidoreductase n=1 Tax=Pseudonocardia nematodicida TaxID=1206997 RepID=A0ABV1KDX9_9PSEU